MFFYGFDMTYLVLVLPCMIFAMIASARVNSTFQKYSEQISRRRLTGAQAAQRVLAANGVTGVRIERVRGNLTSCRISLTWRRSCARVRQTAAFPTRRSSPAPAALRTSSA